MSSIEPHGYGNNHEPIVSALTESQKELCEKLDEIHKRYGLEMMPSKMFEGAIFVSDKRLRHNPDWLSQAANSLREILYPFYGGYKKDKNLKKTKLYQDSAIKNKHFESEIGRVWKLVNALAHHGNSDQSKLSKQEIDNYDYDNLIYNFEILMRDALTRQLDLYKRINDLIQKGLKNTKKEDLTNLINANLDAKDYFFTQTPSDWISWLNTNGFFDILNKEAEDKSRYSFRLPELSYLVRVADSEKHQEEVIKIMNAVECDKNFNPEVVEQFLWIAQKLTPQNLLKIVPKIEKENWVYLMRNFRDSGYSYESLVKKLTEAKEYEGLLTLAKAMLTTNKEKRKDTYTDRYFYLSDLEESGIFDALSKLQGEHAKKGIEFITKILTEFPQEQTESEIFETEDPFSINDIDFFNVQPKKQSQIHFKEDIFNLFTTLTLLIQSTIGTSCDTNAREIFDQNIKNLPDSQTLWRLTLYTLSLCPIIFETDLKKALNRIFIDSPQYGKLLLGTEYLKTLKKIFPTWSDGEDGEKKLYIKKIFEKFKKLEQQFPDQKWHKKNGYEIMSTIAPDLTPEEKKQAEELFGKLNEKFEPKPLEYGIKSGWVQNQSWINFAEYKDISQIPRILTKEQKQDKNEDFLHPHNIEGTAENLKEDMKTRMSEYIAHAQNFLDEKIHIHYTYSFLRGIEEHLREKKKLAETDWKNLFELFDKIHKFPKQEPNEQDNERWLARWNWVEKTMADILKYFCTKDNENAFKNHRNQTLTLITYLLKSKDPTPEDETAKHGGDLYTIAINSTRSVAFEAFVNFIYLDGKGLKTDALTLYQKTVESASLSVRFLIGRYLASFYYRDKSKVEKLFKTIFTKKTKEEFCASWEGYLSSSLYKELFEALQKDYSYALNIKAKDYPKRARRYRDLDEGIGTHLALAFAHFNDVKYNKSTQHGLLKLLWQNSNTKKQKEFISFLGRGIISHEKAGNEWFKEQKIDLQKLKDFWSLIVKENNIDPEVYAAFGFWVNHKKDIFEDYDWLAEMMAKTLTKSEGAIDWEYGLEKTLPELAAANPKKTLIILEKYLVDGVLGGKNKRWFHLDDSITSTFETLYKTEPENTKNLINTLLEKGGKTFWPLKDIVK